MKSIVPGLFVQNATNCQDVSLAIAKYAVQKWKTCLSSIAHASTVIKFSDKRSIISHKRTCFTRKNIACQDRNQWRRQWSALPCKHASSVGKFLESQCESKFLGSFLRPRQVRDFLWDGPKNIKKCYTAARKHAHVQVPQLRIRRV